MTLLHETVLENVVFDEHNREVDYSDKSVTGDMLFSFSAQLNSLLVECA